MSEPIRYDFDEYGGCYELPDGDYVLYDDYKKQRDGFLWAMEQLERLGHHNHDLKESNERISKSVKELIDENIKLRQQL